VRIKRIRRIRAITLSVTAAVLLAAALTAFNSDRTAGNAASLKHIDEIVAQRGEFHILEIVPDVKAASFGYFIGGQEPISREYFDASGQLSGWLAALSKTASPAGRSAFANGLFGRLAAKGILGNSAAAPLKSTYYENGSYYAEAYLADDPQSWNTLPLAAPESVVVKGVFSEAENGAFRADYVYTPSEGGGYIQNISRFEYAAAHEPGFYYYSPAFTLMDLEALAIEFTSAWDTWAGVAVYALDTESGIYTCLGTVEEIVQHSGGFNLDLDYYYVDQAGTGAPGTDPIIHQYKAIVSMADLDDAPGDGFTTPAAAGDPPVPGPSYFSRAISSYTHVGSGGNYALTPDENGPSNEVRFNSVYYKAGYVNNNLFKRHVFGLADPADNPDHLPDFGALDVTVTVKAAGEVTPSDIGAADMVYISAGTDITDGGAATGYAFTDLPDAAAVALYNAAAGLKPIILDYTIIRGLTEASQLKRVEKLCLLCLQPAIAATAETSLSSLAVDWPGLAYIDGDADRTFVSNNIYCFNAFNTAGTGAVPDPENPVPGDIFTLVSAMFTEVFSHEVYSSGFSDVLTVIQDENFLKQIAGQSDQLPENVTVAASVRHIINFKGRRMTNPKTSITVLDLEPGKVTTTGLTKNTVRGWIGETEDTFPDSQIKIVHMTTSEFIGKIEDINETYDMIYIGMSVESFNTVSGSTVYNDPGMNGLVYSSIGDIYTGTFEMAGIREQDYVTIGGVKAISGGTGSTANRFRFSGNDITAAKVSELKKFAQAGYPIILADGFVSGSGVNTNKVDSSSYMYEAVSGLYGVYANVMKQSFASNPMNTETVIKYLNVSKPAISLKDKPAEYDDAAGTSIIPDPNDGYYYLNYVFSIGNITDPTPISTTYDCRLYIDLNADGRYAPNEKLDDISVRRVSDGALVLPEHHPDTGREYYLLSADVEYQVTRQMPQDYVGIIPWKLEVIKNGADHIHASAQGFTRIAAGADKQTVKVLQIMAQGTSNTKLNLSKQLSSNPKGIYGQLISNLADFDVTIDAIENDDLESISSGQPDPVEAIFDYLKTYDMLIIGFNDCYDGIGQHTAPAIVRYINLGKSVLFTHDTTSMSQVPSATYPMAVNSSSPNRKTLNNKDVVWNSVTQEYRSVNGAVSQFGPYSGRAPLPGGYTLVGTYNGSTYSIDGRTWHPGTALPFLQKELYRYTVGSNKIPNSILDWGYYFNTVIRDAVGLDRYGVTSLIDIGGGQKLGDIVNVSAPLPPESIETILDYNRSVAYAPKSGRGLTVNEYQGYTNYALIRFSPSGGSTYKYTNYNYRSDNSYRETTSVSQVNKGQITTYPYNVNTAAFGGTDGTITGYGGSYMKIGKTHEQYFQINMNTDDIVVWYCLSNGTADDMYDWYGDVPNDCINAYYIYNKGNVTYSGVGHSSDASLYGPGASQEYVNEAKLFVNTMIAAYQSALQAPSVAIKKDARGTIDASVKYVLADETSVLSSELPPTDESRAVYFRISDPNVGVEKTITVEYYVSDDAAGAVNPTVDEDRKVSLLELTTYYADGTEAAVIKGGHVYKVCLADRVGSVEVLDQLKNSDVYSIKLYVKVTTTIGSTQLAPAVDSIEIKKRQLFELT
jgi:hypothetical protein